MELFVQEGNFWSKRANWLIYWWTNPGTWGNFIDDKFQNINAKLKQLEKNEYVEYATNPNLSGPVATGATAEMWPGEG